MMPQSPVAMEEEEEEEEEVLMSEVHVGCPPNLSGPHISRFTFPFPLFSTTARDEPEWGHDDQPQGYGSSTPMLGLDDDGDLVLARRNRQSSHAQNCPQSIKQPNHHAKELSPSCVFSIQHSITSSLPSVGLQVWMAALVLTDFIIFKSSTTSEFSSVTALELGAGTGLVGLALALVARTVFITDRGSDVLDNCTTNVRLNSSILKYAETRIHVRELDWKGQWPPSVHTCHSESQRSTYLWASSEIEEAEGASVILAADVIYSNELTNSLFGILESLMSRGVEKVLYLALEKRYNFSMDDLDVVANGYAHFRSFLKDEEECRQLDGHSLPYFKGEQIDLAQIPQYIREYERGKDLELWKITYCRKKSERRVSSNSSS